MIRKNHCKLGVELLEDRCVPAANSVLLQNGVLNIVVEPNKAHSVVVSQDPEAGSQVPLETTTVTVTFEKFRG